MKYLALAWILLATVSCAALAGDSQLAGTWKLNFAESKFSGETFTISETATGFHYSNGSTVSYDFATDGKDYPMIPGRTIAWTKSGDATWDMVIKDAHGTVQSKGQRTISADGGKQTLIWTHYNADGTTMRETSMRTRVSGGPGLAGTWTEVNLAAASHSMIVSVPSAGHIRYQYPEQRQIHEGPTDGTPSPVVGSNVAEGATMAFKQLSSRKLAWTFAVKGAPVQQGVDTVSADGKTLSSESWPAGKPKEKTIEVYDRQ
jgi:hypothetical protein